MFGAGILTNRTGNSKYAMYNVPVTAGCRHCLIHIPQFSTDSMRWAGVYRKCFIVEWVLVAYRLYDSYTFVLCGIVYSFKTKQMTETFSSF